LAIRPLRLGSGQALASPSGENPHPNNGKFSHRLTRQVVLVTTSDRLQIPPIAHFCQLVRQIKQSMIKNLENHHVQP
ncbi:MAG: hypothetical protein ACKO8M_04350, partial [Microcystis panniformis]